MLSDRAARHPDRSAVTFIADDGSLETLTYGDLDRRAQSVAADLSAHCNKGDRALLLFPPGLDFLIGFFGASYAGLVPTPTCFPKPRRAMPRLDSAAQDCQPSALLADKATLAGIDPSRLSAQVNGLHQVATDESHAGTFDLDVAQIDASDLGLLQYTSGSTSDPKGVMVSHANLLSNLESIRQGFSLDWVDDDTQDVARGVFWLPAFHDMGLIGGILEPLYVGGETVLMSPRYFLQRPMRWLCAISDFRADISGAPNFAYQLCVDRFTANQLADLDLSCWKTAFCGAEPIMPDTLDAFGEKFAAYGFRANSFYPCYGLAEATLLAAGGDGSSKPKYLSADRDALAEGRYVRAFDDQDGATLRRLVSCGSAAATMRIEIVDPQTGKAQPEGSIGEIWLQGASVARGYWGREDINTDRFAARIAGLHSAGTFFRTGDLGFLCDGDLYVTGRTKDIIILRGRNVYPQDIEATVRQSLNEQCGGQAAAVAMPGVQGDALAIVVEVCRHADEQSMPEIVRRLRRAIIEEHELDARTVVLVRPGSVPLTTSGKVQRQACRQLLMDDSLRSRHRWDRSQQGDGKIAYPELPVVIDENNFSRVSAAIEQWLLAWLVSRCGANEAELAHRDRPFAEYGIDSLAAVELAGEIEDWLGLELTPTLAWNYPSPADLAPFLAKQIAGFGTDGDVGDHVGNDDDETESDFDALLSEIENMSDDEIKNALADHNG